MTSVSLAAAAGPNDFRDELATFDAGRWVAISPAAGRGTLDPANVAVANGQLGIKLPAGTFNGGEMRSTSLYRWGSYRVRMKVANAPTSLTAFFLYRPPDYQREIDIELWNDVPLRKRVVPELARRAGAAHRPLHVCRLDRIHRAVG